MMQTHRKAIWFVVALFAALPFLFQNCGPAKLKGDSSSSSEQNQNSTVGTKVDLAALQSAAQEPASNLIFPASGSVRDASYAAGNLMIENLILKTNDFTRIEWIHSTTSTVIANGLSFSSQVFSADLTGNVLIYGYRGTTPFYLGTIRLIARGTSTLSATSVGAVTINQKTLGNDGSNDNFEIDINTPNVDVAAIQFSSRGIAVKNQRAYLLQKLPSENVDVAVTVTDANGQVFSQTLNFPAQSVTPPPPVSVHIRTRVNNSSVVDAPDSTNGVAVHLWSYLAIDNQAFQLTSANEIRVHGKCIMPSSAAAGASVVLADCTGATEQKWNYNSSTGVIQAQNGFCLDLNNSQVADGATISIWTCNGGTNQAWDLVQ